MGVEEEEEGESEWIEEVGAMLLLIEVEVDGRVVENNKGGVKDNLVKDLVDRIDFDNLFNID